MERITDKNYINIQGWMYSLGCKRLEEVVVYALIYGFSQDEETKFNGSLSYIQEFLMCSKPTAISVIKSLMDMGLIQKNQYTINKVVFNQYTAIIPPPLPVVKNSYQCGKEILQGGSKEFLQQINIDNNKGNINPTPLSPKGKSHKVLDLSFIDREDYIPIMEEWLAYKKEKGQTYKPTGLRICYRKLVEYSNGNAEKAKQIIEEAMSNNYSGFFPLKQQSNGNNNRSSIQYGNPLYQGVVAEMERELGPLNF